MDVDKGAVKKSWVEIGGSLFASVKRGDVKSQGVGAVSLVEHLCRSGSAVRNPTLNWTGPPAAGAREAAISVERHPQTFEVALLQRSINRSHFFLPGVLKLYR